MARITVEDCIKLVNNQYDLVILAKERAVQLGRGATPIAVNGYPLAMTNQVPSNLTKGSTSGSCSAVVMGDFSQALLGLFGGGESPSITNVSLCGGANFSPCFSRVLAQPRGFRISWF